MGVLVLLAGLASNEVGVLLVEREIGQMLEVVVFILFAHFDVRLCCETHQTVLVDKDPERVTPENQHVDAKVEFKVLVQ